MSPSFFQKRRVQGFPRFLSTERRECKLPPAGRGKGDHISCPSPHQCGRRGKPFLSLSLVQVGKKKGKKDNSQSEAAGLNLTQRRGKKKRDR